MPRTSRPDAYAHDLLGESIPSPEALRKDGQLRKIGYADRPGSGPKKQRCGTCIFLQRCLHLGNESHKCELMAPIWNYRPETDVSPRAPACSKWESRPFTKIKY